ncbi:MAG: hypothetical protein ABH857_01020 [Elusimicrobiota bacterium]
MKKNLIILLFILASLTAGNLYAGSDARIKLSTSDASSGFWIQNSAGVVVSTVASNGRVYFKGNVGIGASPGNYKLIVSTISLAGSFSGVKFPDGSIAVSTTTLAVSNSLESANGSIPNVVYVNAQGNIGIGTTQALNYKLTVKGSSYFGDNVEFIYNKFINTDRIQARDNSGLRLLNYAGTNGLLIHDTGYVGIGTTNPAGLVHISKGSPAPADYILKIKKGANTVLSVKADGKVGVGTDGGDELFTAGNNVFQIDKTGNIKKIRNIASSWPSAHAEGYLKNDNSGNYTWASGGSGVGGSGTSNYIAKFGSGGSQVTDSVIYQSSQKIGIGTTTVGADKLRVAGPEHISERLTVNGYITTMRIEAEGPDGLGIRDDGGNYGIIVKNDGNVGIGSSINAREKLEVSGDVYAQNYYYGNYQGITYSMQFRDLDGVDRTINIWDGIIESIE